MDFFENTVPHLPPLNLSDLWWGVPGGQEKSSLNAEKKQGGNEWSKVQINKLNQAKNTTIFVGPNKNIHGCCCGDFFFYNSHPVFPVPLWTCDMSQWLSYCTLLTGQCNDSSMAIATLPPPVHDISIIRSFTTFILSGVFLMTTLHLITNNQGLVRLSSAVLSFLIWSSISLSLSLSKIPALLECYNLYILDFYSFFKQFKIKLHHAKCLHLFGMWHVSVLAGGSMFKSCSPAGGNSNQPTKAENRKKILLQRWGIQQKANDPQHSQHLTSFPPISRFKCVRNFPRLHQSFPLSIHLTYTLFFLLLVPFVSDQWFWPNYNISPRFPWNFRGFPLLFTTIWGEKWLVEIRSRANLTRSKSKPFNHPNPNSAPELPKASLIHFQTCWLRMEEADNATPPFLQWFPAEFQKTSYVVMKRSSNRLIYGWKTTFSFGMITFQGLF